MGGGANLNSLLPLIISKWRVGGGGHKKIVLDPSSNLIGDKCYHANADAESVFFFFFFI